ncbi:MAG: hypothetical protein NVS1B12_04410 [Acidimicrobiales bacterium]
MASQFGEHRVGKDLPGAHVPGRPEVVIGRLDVDAGGAHHLHRLTDDFGADAVASDDGDAVAHGWFLCWFGKSGNKKPPTEWTVEKRTPIGVR